MGSEPETNKGLRVILFCFVRITDIKGYIVTVMAMNHKNDDVDVNAPGYDAEESPYYDNDKEKEEADKVPVEYLGYLQQQKEVRKDLLFFWIVFLIVLLGFGPGTKGKIFCARSGEWRAKYTYAWGYLDYHGTPTPTEWTEWYNAQNPEPHQMRWVPYGKTHPALFGVMSVPMGTGVEWFQPENLIERMEELDDLFRMGHVMEIPRVLAAVNYAREWNAIIEPLTVGTAQEARQFWNQHKDDLIDWSNDEAGTLIPESYLYEAERYVEEMTEEDGNHIPLY